MQFEYLYDREQIKAAIASLQVSQFVYCDTETTGLNVRKDKLVDIQLAGDSGPVFMFPGEFAAELLNITPALVFHNLRFDLKILYHSSVNLLNHKILDTLILDHLVDENKPHDLDTLIQERFADDYKKNFWRDFKSYEEAPFNRRLDYACRDVHYLRLIHRELVSKLKTQGIPASLVEHVHRLAMCLLETEISGVKLDLEYCTEIGSELKEDISRTEVKLRDLGGIHCDLIETNQWHEHIKKLCTPKGKKWLTIEKPTFNFSSSAQVVDLLYNQLELPPQYNWNKKLRKKSLTADDAAIEELGDAHPILPELRRYRKYTKMYSSFIEGSLALSENGRIYPSFNVTGTKTGRLSHSEPNLAQMPSKADEFSDWVKIRGIFVPEAEHYLASVDYSMLEVVIAAHFSQDKNLLSIIYDNASKHDITAAALAINRSTAKTLNFALQYQCGPKKVAKIIGCSEKEGQYYWNKYWETYAGEKKVIDECNRLVDQGKPITTPFGRQRHLPNKFKNEFEREAVYRQAYSSLIQGTGADLCNWAFYTANNELQAKKLGRCLWSVHDEVVAQITVPKFEEGQSLIVDTMVKSGQVINLLVPLKAEPSGPLLRWTK